MGEVHNTYTYIRTALESAAGWLCSGFYGLQRVLSRTVDQAPWVGGLVGLVLGMWKSLASFISAGIHSFLDSFFDSFLGSSSPQDS